MGYKIRRQTARGLLKAVGYEKADEYTDKLILKKLGYLSDMTEEEAAEKVPRPLKRVFDTMRASLAKSEPLEIVDDPAPPEEGGPLRGRPKSDDGISHTIIRTLQAASEEHPATKAEILQTLCAKFDDRDPNAMRTTLDKWVMSGLRNAGYDIRRNTNGYWIEPKPPE